MSRFWQRGVRAALVFVSLLALSLFFVGLLHAAVRGQHVPSRGEEVAMLVVVLLLNVIVVGAGTLVWCVDAGDAPVPSPGVQAKPAPRPGMPQRRYLDRFLLFTAGVFFGAPVPVCLWFLRNVSSFPRLPWLSAIGLAVGSCVFGGLSMLLSALFLACCIPPVDRYLWHKFKTTGQPTDGQLSSESAPCASSDEASS